MISKKLVMERTSTPMAVTNSGENQRNQTMCASHDAGQSVRPGGYASSSLRINHWPHLTSLVRDRSLLKTWSFINIFLSRDFRMR